MDKCPAFEHLLVIPRLRVQNANAVSSPQTHGFPSMTAFIGLMWALERKTQSAGLDLQFNALGVVVHQHQEQVSDDPFIKTFRLSRNPIDKDGKTAAIVEEGRIHLELSLVFAVQSETLDAANAQTKEDIAQQMKDFISQMRIAGGSVLPSRANRYRQQPYVAPADDETFGKIKLRLLPGFVLVERQDMLEVRHQELMEQNPNASKLDAWLSLSRINWHWQEGEEGTQGEWQYDRKNLGWLVPIPLGYGALTEVQEAGTVANARDTTVPFRFVESLYGIGQWLSPHRLHQAEQLLWYADSRPDEGLYRCRNDYKPTPVYDID